MTEDLNNTNMAQVQGTMHNDLLVKKFNNLEQVKPLLQLSMTLEQEATVDFDTLTVETIVLSSPASMNTRYSDLCAKVTLKDEVDNNGDKIVVHFSIVIDHDNSPDRELMVHVLQCMTSLYLKRAVIVVPIILYHGESERVETKSFSEFAYADLSEEIQGIF